LKVRVRAVGWGGEGSLLVEEELVLGREASVEEVFKRADQALKLSRPLFGPALEGRLPATVLLNGDRLDLDQERFHRLVEGDEISLIQGLAGG